MVRGSAPRERGPAYLTVVVEYKEVQRRPLTGPLTLGRSLDCDLWIDDPRLSRRHCTIEPALEGDGWVVTDLESKNGTFVNAKRVKDRVPLNHGDVISLGKAQVKFKASGYLPPRPADPAEAMLLPARTRAAMDNRHPTPHQNRPLPQVRVNSADSTIGAPSSAGETIAGGTPSPEVPGKPLPFTRPPARPIVKPVEEE